MSARPSFTGRIVRSVVLAAWPLAACGGGASGTGGTGGTGGGAPCAAPADCPQPQNDCQLAACDAGACGLAPKAKGAICAQGAGTCDGNGQCNLCEPGFKACNGSTLLVCGESGTFDDPITCGGDTPYCDPADPKCVGCFDTSQCVTPGMNPCLAVACLENACVTTLVADGSACLVNGQEGTCSGGACQLCMPGTKACRGDSLLTCGPDGMFDVAPCGLAKPYCDPSVLACAECLDATQCTSLAGPCVEAACTAGACGITYSGDGVACSLGGQLGTCDGAGQCNLCEPGTKACGANAVLTCGPDGMFDAAPCGGATPYCDPAALIPQCVECTLANQCPAPGGTCQVATCSDNLCSDTTAPNGTACNVGGDPGACTAGACVTCTNGQTRCSPAGNNLPQKCVGGQWANQPSCGGATPYCSSGSCVAPFLLSQNKVADQSSFYPGNMYPPSIAVNGVLNDFTGHNPNIAEAGWWSVDLGQVRTVTKIDVWNRLDCCQDRVANFDLKISMDGIAWTTIATELGQALRPTSYPVMGVGRYVRLERKVVFPAGKPLNIAEVQVWGF
jgi:hypothetical protein